MASIEVLLLLLWPALAAAQDFVPMDAGRAFVIVWGVLSACFAMGLVVYTFVTSEVIWANTQINPTGGGSYGSAVTDERIEAHRAEQADIIAELTLLRERLRDGSIGEEALRSDSFNVLLSRLEGTQQEFRAVLEGGNAGGRQMPKEQQQLLVSQSQTMLEILSQVMSTSSGGGGPSESAPLGMETERL